MSINRKSNYLRHKWNRNLNIFRNIDYSDILQNICWGSKFHLGARSVWTLNLIFDGSIGLSSGQVLFFEIVIMSLIVIRD